MHKQIVEDSTRTLPRLVGQDQRVPTADGVLRRSMVDERQIDALLAAVGSLAADGPRLAYAPDLVTRQLMPREDARDWPELGIRLSGARRGSGAPCL